MTLKWTCLEYRTYVCVLFRMITKCKLSDDHDIQIQYISTMLTGCIRKIRIFKH